MLDLTDIQGTVLRQRPAPYTGAYYLLRVREPQQGRELLSRLLPHVASAENWWNPPSNAWVSVALSYNGLAALGLPGDMLATFAPEFRQGMASRAAVLGDVGQNAPSEWEPEFVSGDGHVAIAAFAAAEADLEAILERARLAAATLPDVDLIYQLRTPQLPSGRTHLGFVDGIGEPLIEGSGLVSTVQAAEGHYGYLPGFGPEVKAGEFVLGYRNEIGNVAGGPRPDPLLRNGTYLSFRKLHIDVAAFRRFLRSNAKEHFDEETVAAKVVGRWRSGAPLVLAPDADETDLAADPARINDFRYAEQDPVGLRCPVGAHIRRMNPRDSLGAGVDVQLHRILRRGTTYGRPLPDGVLEDDGEDRGIAFIFMGTDIGRQFEFVRSQWMNDGDFAGLGGETDPLVGVHQPGSHFTVPARPLRRRLTGLSTFVRTRGGGYFFLPGLRALRWLADGSYAR